MLEGGEGRRRAHEPRHERFILAQLREQTLDCELLLEAGDAIDFRAIRLADGARPQQLDAVVAPEVERALSRVHGCSSVSRGGADLLTDERYGYSGIVQLPSDVELLRSQTRRLVDRDLRPRTLEIEREPRIPDELVAKLRELGYFGLTIPERYGGARPAALPPLLAPSG